MFRFFFDWLANKNMPWSVNCECMSDRLIVIEKQPGIPLFGVRKFWRRLFAKCVLRVTGTESTNMCKDGQICSGLKVEIDEPCMVFKLFGTITH